MNADKKDGVDYCIQPRKPHPAHKTQQVKKIVEIPRAVMASKSWLTLYFIRIRSRSRSGNRSSDLVLYLHIKQT